MNRFNKMNDEELKSFVQNNQPVPPQADGGELNHLMHKLNIENKTVAETATGWLWLATGLAASLFMFHFVATNPSITPSIPAATVAENTFTPPVALEEDDIYTESDIHTLDIGEEYLTLAGL